MMAELSLRQTSKQQKVAGLLPQPPSNSVTRQNVSERDKLIMCNMHAPVTDVVVTMVQYRRQSDGWNVPALKTAKTKFLSLFFCAVLPDQSPTRAFPLTIQRHLHPASSMRSSDLLTSVLLLVCLLSCSAFTWEPCDADKVPFIPDHVDLLPDPPAAGGQVVFKIQGNAGICVTCASAWSEASHATVQPACSVLIHLFTLVPTYASPPAVHDVPSGLISINVSFAGTQIYEEVDDLCSKTTCPIKTGPLDITYVQDLPPIAPPVSRLDSNRR
jgi:hypothetical protein